MWKIGRCACRPRSETRFVTARLASVGIDLNGEKILGQIGNRYCRAGAEGQGEIILLQVHET